MENSISHNNSVTISPRESACHRLMEKNANKYTFAFDEKYLHELAERLATRRMQSKYRRLRRKIGRGVWMLTTFADDHNEYLKITQEISRKQLIYVSFRALGSLVFVTKNEIEELKGLYNRDHVLIMFINYRPALRALENAIVDVNDNIEQVKTQFSLAMNCQYCVLCITNEDIE